MATAADRVVDLYRRHAGAWAAARGEVLRERAWIERFALFRASLPDVAAEVADMRTLSRGSRSGGLIAWDSLFHLAPHEQRLMFPVFRDHAGPGAPLLFTSGPASGEEVGTFQGEPLYHASLDPGEYRLLLGRHGFDVVAHVTEDPDCDGHTVWLARRRRR